MYQNGHSKTVYSLVWPETENLIKSVLQNKSEQMLSRHRHPHRKAQDQIGPDFAAQWWSWSGLSEDPSSVWSHFYPTAGASEAIREGIHLLGVKKGALLIFDGEYEGYAAIAQAINVPVHTIRRSHWREDIQALDPHLPYQWWVSQPSSIDGCVWSEFDIWVQEMQNYPNVDVWVDVSYVGSISQPYASPYIHPKYIAGLVFSLSKPAGVYYRRIGGCFARDPLLTLFGNMWFKNIDSIMLGQEWIARFDVNYVSRTYRSLQEKVVLSWAAETPDVSHHYLWKPSDVIMLAHSHDRPAIEQDERYRRGHGYRVCLTPDLSDEIDARRLLS